MTERERICACAERANHRYQQWMPQRWLDFFIEAWEAYDPTVQPYDEPFRHVDTNRASTPADVAGLVERLRISMDDPHETWRDMTFTQKDADDWGGLMREAAAALSALALERNRLREAARSALGCLDDPTGGQHITDMRRAADFLRAALARNP